MRRGVYVSVPWSSLVVPIVYKPDTGLLCREV